MSYRLLFGTPPITCTPGVRTGTIVASSGNAH